MMHHSPAKFWLENWCTTRNSLNLSKVDILKWALVTLLLLISESFCLAQLELTPKSMAGKSTPSKKVQRVKSKSRPISTTALSEPLIAETSSAASFSAFSESGLLFFAHIALAVDKYRLRVFDTESGKAIAESVFQNSRVSTVHWASLPTSATDNNAGTGDETAITSRERKKRKSVSDREIFTEDLIVIGFSNGTLAIFSPRQGEIARTLSTPSSNDAILSIASKPASPSSPHPKLWSSGANGSLCSWDVHAGNLLTAWRYQRHQHAIYCYHNPSLGRR